MTVPRQRVLLVEDDRGLASLYRQSLRFAGYDVDVAADGFSALWRIEEARPDLIVLDLHLPRLRGEAILQELAANPEMCQIPVIVVTGVEARLTVAQASAILQKPCDPDRLLSVVAEHLAVA